MSEPQPKTEPATEAQAPAPAGEKKLSNKELKELKKKEKAAKRSAQKEANGISMEKQQQVAQQKREKKAAAAAPVVVEAPKKKEKTTPLFGHLETAQHRSITIATGNVKDKEMVHPLTLQLATQISSYQIVGSTPRCRAMLNTFKELIRDYQTPKGTTLSRNLTQYLNHQIEWLKNARPLSMSMGNAIRWLKQAISLIPLEKSDSEAKDQLINSIDEFINHKLTLSHDAICENSEAFIKEGKHYTILTYGCSEVVKSVVKYHAARGVSLRLIVVDSRPLFEGKKMARELTGEGIQCQYVLMNALGSVFSQPIDFVFLGAHALLSNGFLYSRVGTAMVALTASNRNINVLVFCESIKFASRVQLDSVTFNELSDPNELIDLGLNAPQKEGSALKKYIADKKALAATKKQQKKGQPVVAPEVDSRTLANWKDIPDLNILNIMYDLTPPELVHKIVTEIGALPPSSVPVILREYKNIGV